MDFAPKPIILVIVGLMISILHIQAQDSGEVHHKELSEAPQFERLSDLFTKGQISGHARNFFMTTINQGTLKDYYANAIGGAMRYESPEFHGFHFGMAGILTYKLFSSDLTEPDPTTGKIAKWEYQLFDVLNLDNFNDLDRIEELYLQYRFNRGSLRYGKIEISDTPLLNSSDGRMKPFAFKGAWLDLALSSRQWIQAAWLDRISPRSTVEWFDFNEGIGLVYNGFQPDGSEADYGDHLQSRGVALLGYTNIKDNWVLKAYHWYIHHLHHTSWLELGYRTQAWDLGLQYSLQFPDGFQKELPYVQRYVQPDENGQVLSGQLSWHPSTVSLRAAYTHAFASGRYLFPRELGRDHFFSSLSRSRLEGFGNVDVLTLSGGYAFTDSGLSADLEWTRLWGPETQAYQYNKYGLDAYWQVNAGLRYAFHGFLEGLSMEMFYVYKQNQNTSAPEVVFNRSNFHQLNFITNFVF